MTLTKYKMVLNCSDEYSDWPENIILSLSPETLDDLKEAGKIIEDNRYWINVVTIRLRGGSDITAVIDDDGNELPTETMQRYEEIGIRVYNGGAWYFAVYNKYDGSDEAEYAFEEQIEEVIATCKV